MNGMAGHKMKRLGLAAPGNGVYKPFQPGHAMGVKHGVQTPRLFEPVADVILEELMATPNRPGYLSDQTFAWSLRGWAVAEAKLLLIENYMDTLGEREQFTATGAQAPVIMHWKQLSEHAARLRSRLGLDPVSRVKIGKALTSAGIDLARLEQYADSSEDGGF